MAFTHAEIFSDIKKQEHLVVVFKYSNICPVSTRAKEQVEEFMEAHPDIPVILVVVQEQRPLSNDIEKKLDVKHESPQAIILEGGEIKGVFNHSDITKQHIEEIIST